MFAGIPVHVVRYINIYCHGDMLVYIIVCYLLSKLFLYYKLGLIIRVHFDRICNVRKFMLIFLNIFALKYFFGRKYMFLYLNTYRVLLPGSGQMHQFGNL